MTVLLVAGWGAASRAATPQDDPFAGLEVLGAAEMAEKRGGFFHPALGITLNLGAKIKSMVNGILVMTTEVNIGTGVPGAIEVSPGVDLTPLTFLSADGAPIPNPGGDIPTTITTGPVTFTAGGTQVTVPAGFQGLVAQTDTGVVAAVNKITQDQLANLVINADPGAPQSDAGTPAAIIQQELHINVDVFGFAGLQESLKLSASFTQFRDAMRAASLSALGAN